MRFALLLVTGSLLATAGGVSWTDETTTWRARREASLKAPNGWLSVAGLFWLHEGANIVGSDAKSDVVLPPGSLPKGADPVRAAVLRVAAGKVTLEPDPRAGLLLNGRPASKTILVTDIADKPDLLQLGQITLTIIDRNGKPGIRLRDPNAETRRNFTGLNWYPADPAWRIKAKWVAYPEPHKIRITNILGVTDEEPAPGYAEFTVRGSTVRLEPVLDDDGSLFFMFKDGTSGRTTYAAGRFLGDVRPKDGFVELDFNKATNPPCVYTAYATCPLPPKQNALTVAIEAGEKKYGNH
jgi:uncharacterized protein (DUF1684 family)